MAVPFPKMRWVLLLLAAWPAPGLVRAQSVWELTPYRVRVVVAASDAPELRGVPRQLAEELSPRLENLLGAAWRVDVVPDTGSSESARPDSPADESADESAVVEEPALSSPPDVWRLPAKAADAAVLPAEWLQGDYDKLLLLRVDSAADGWRVRVREWDAATCRLGPVLTYSLWQPAKLRDTAVRAVLAAFRPLAQVDRVETREDGMRAGLRLRAGGLPTRDPDLQLARAGQLFCPVVRLNDRDGGLRRDREGNVVLPQPVPWTFLVVEGIEAGEADVRVHSGLSAPLSAGRRGRVEQLALSVVPRRETTRLVLLGRREPHEPMAGYEVLVQRPGEKATQLVGRTDRAGSVELAPTDQPLAIVLVRSGQQLLARLPVAAGFTSEATAYVPDDTQRLEVEAFVSALQEQLVDTVTRREVLLARAESQLEAGRPGEAREMLDTLQRLPDRETLRRRLVTRQGQLRSSDPHVQRQIETLFGDTSKLLDRHLDPAPVEALARALARRASRPQGEAAGASEDTTPAGEPGP